MQPVLRAAVLRLTCALVTGAVAGCVGSAFGWLLTAFNNAVLVPRGDAATGSYLWWVEFFAAPFAVSGAVAGLLVGPLFLKLRRASGK